MVSIETTAVMVYTGIKVKFKADLMRRVVPVWIDANNANNANQDKKFKHDPYEEWVQEHRAKLVPVTQCPEVRLAAPDHDRC